MDKIHVVLQKWNFTIISLIRRYLQKYLDNYAHCKFGAEDEQYLHNYSKAEHFPVITSKKSFEKDETNQGEQKIVKRHERITATIDVMCVRA